MSFDSGPLDRYLSSAFGDDPAMAMDLRVAFTGSARDLADLVESLAAPPMMDVIRVGASPQRAASGVAAARREVQ